MARIETIVEAALADLEVAGVPGPAQLNAETAENACDLAIARQQQRHRRSGVDLAALLEGLAELRQWRRDTEHAEIRTGTGRMDGRTVAQALVTHYPTDVARHMLACEITLGIEPDAVPGTRHSLNHAPKRMALIVLRDHRWGVRYRQDDSFGEPREVARFAVPAWFLHPPETPLARFAPPPDAPVLLPAMDLPGRDLTSRGIRDVSLESCIRACREIRGCRAFSYVEDRRWCWPKETAGAGQTDHRVLSGIMPGTVWRRD